MGLDLPTRFLEQQERITAFVREAVWLLSGQKHFVTGGDGAGFVIVLATTGEQPDEAVTIAKHAARAARG